MAEDPDAIPSMQLAWEMIELARVIYKQRDEVSTDQHLYVSNYTKLVSLIPYHFPNTYSVTVFDFELTIWF